ncbi:hypothetical protein ACS0TY_004766 [Phlomoides rotata]
MASYAAVLSLFHTLNNIKNHPRPPISLDQSQVDSLTQNLTFFQDFLERYPSQEDYDFESRIAAAAYAAEDVIESNIFDQIHDLSKISILDLCECLRRVMGSIKNEVMKIMGAQTVDHRESISSMPLRRGLERAIQEMDLIRKELIEIIQQKIMSAQDHDQHINFSVSTSSGGPTSTWRSSTVPVFDKAIINEVLDKLTGQQTGLKIIPIVGMGGIGKTTFARNIYGNPLIVHHFDLFAWVTISQEYSRGNILQVLCQEAMGSINGFSEMSEDEMGLKLYQHLWGRRYLIVMDDIWSVEAWGKVKSFFPDNNGSRIMITTRLSNLAFELSDRYVFKMQFLEDNKSWDLLCEIVFGKLDCPIELADIGNKIARKCRGLPLSIAVIGGLLKKSDMTQAYWLYTLENLNLLINLDDDEYTLRIMLTSYKELPMHLRPCFLYMGLFPEDYEIKTSKLIKLWVAEGILRPVDNKSLEEVAKDYLKELIDRNLMLISELRWDGEAKLCRMHDLLRDVCLREAQKQKLFCIVRQQKHHTPQGIDIERRICINPENENTAYSPQFLQAVESASHIRSLLYNMSVGDASPSLRFRLLRVYLEGVTYYGNATYSNNAIFKQVNLRYLSVKFDFLYTPRLLSLCSHFWNLQTLDVQNGHWFSFELIIPSAIWEIPSLRHVKLFNFVLPDPPNGEHHFVLKNLQTLKCVINFKFSEEVVKRIPNIRKLSLEFKKEHSLPDFCLNNLGRLQKLESLTLEKEINRSLVTFPQSLKKLILVCTRLGWEDLTRCIGSLPLLQFLALRFACVGLKWETAEGNFCSLRVLKIWCYDLRYWETDSVHFPRLEHLRLHVLEKLEEIPSCIGDIPTLKSILVRDCNKSVTDSAKRIKVEQEENGNEDLQVVIKTRYMREDWT